MGGRNQPRGTFSQRVRRATREAGETVAGRPYGAGQPSGAPGRGWMHAQAPGPGRAAPPQPADAPVATDESRARILQAIRRQHPAWQEFYVQQAEALAAQLAKDAAEE